MKKILIIKPPYNHCPIGIGYVLSCLEQDGIPFDFWDTLRPNFEEKYYLDNIRQGKYLLVGTGGFVFNINFFIEITEKCRLASPKTPIILGGNITRSMSTESLFEYLNVDFIYKGEAEVSFPDFVHALAADSPDHRTIPGICFRDEQTGEMVKNPPGRVDLSLNSQMPAWHHLDVPFYISTHKHPRFDKIGRALPMLTGRGCTGGCSFCSPTVGKFMSRNLEDTLNEIRYLNAHYEFETFSFITEIFFLTDEQVLEFCEGYKTLEERKPWFCCLHPKISPAVFPAMKEAGCVGVNMGLESGSDPILAKLKAGCTTDRFRENYHAATKAGITVDATFMVASENETEDDLKATFDFLIENDMEQPNFSPVIIYPGTSVYNKARKRGQIKDEFHYLTQDMSYRPWRVYNIAEFPYVNISAIPDNRLFEALVKQTRRYFTHLFRNYQAQDIAIRKKNGSVNKAPAQGNSGHDTLEISGKCFKCDSPLEKNLEANNSLRFIEVKEQCPKCLANNYFDLTTDENSLNHFAKLKQSLSRAKKILILGRGSNALDLFFYDIIGLDLDKVIGVVDERSEEDELAGIEENSNSGKRLFFHLPRYRSEEIRNLDFDVALVTDLIPEVLSGFYPAERRKSLLWLTPESGPLSTPVNPEIMSFRSLPKKRLPFLSALKRRFTPNIPDQAASPDI